MRRELVKKKSLIHQNTLSSTSTQKTPTQHIKPLAQKNLNLVVKCLFFLFSLWFTTVTPHCSFSSPDHYLFQHTNTTQPPSLIQNTTLYTSISLSIAKTTISVVARLITALTFNQLLRPTINTVKPTTTSTSHKNPAPVATKFSRSLSPRHHFLLKNQKQPPPLWATTNLTYNFGLYHASPPLLIVETTKKEKKKNEKQTYELDLKKKEER